MDTGPEAKAYADHYILVHMNAASDGRTYQEVSGEYQAMSDEEKASPEGQALAGLRETLFQGNTLRGLLLYGYAFATMGTIAGIAAIGAYIGAVILLVLGLLGMRHARRAAAEEQATGAGTRGTFRHGLSQPRQRHMERLVVGDETQNGAASPRRRDHSTPMPLSAPSFLPRDAVDGEAAVGRGEAALQGRLGEEGVFPHPRL